MQDVFSKLSGRPASLVTDISVCRLKYSSRNVGVEQEFRIKALHLTARLGIGSPYH